MKTIRKFAICLLVVMLLPMNSVLGIAATTESVSTYDVGINVLKAIDVLSENDISSDMDELITRAEYAMLMIRLRGWETLAFQNEENRYFYDVDPEYYETRHINLAASMGIMGSENSEYFYPEKAVTSDDAVKALLAVLGYDPIAKSKGGKASDYMQIATQKGLLKGVNMSAVNISRGDVYKILVNSLDIPVVAEEAISKTNSEYTITKEKTLLTEYHGIYLSKGIVTASDVTPLNPDKNEAGEGRIEISGELYNTEDAAYQELLGYNVKYYYKVVDGERELVYAYKYLNESVTIKAIDIISFSNLKYTYSQQNNKKTIANVTGAYFIYNGTAMEGDNDDFVPVLGTVEIIDNNNDGKYEVVKINSYEEYGVTAISTVDYSIKTASDVTLMLDEEKVKIVNYTNGASIKFADIRPKSVISVARDSKGEIIKVVIHNSYKFGEIDSISYDDNWEVEIEGVMYTVSPALKKSIENGRADKLELGLSAYYVLNFNNEIAYWYTDFKRFGEDAWVIGLFKEAGLTRNSLEISVFTLTETFEYYKIGKKVNIDGVKYTNLKEVYERFCRNGETGTLQDEPVPQLIRFKLKGDGTVSDIDFVGEENPTKEGLFKAASTDPEEELWYYGATFNGKYAVDGNTLVFQYPAGMDLSDESKVSCARIGNVFSDNSTWKNLDFYKVKSDDIIMNVVCNVGTKSYSIDNGAPLSILLDVRYVVDEYDEVKTQLTYATDGTTYKKVISEDIDLNNIEVNDGTTHSLKVGDCFRCNADSFGEINYIQPIYDYSTHKLLGKSYNGTYEMNNSFLRPRQSEQFYAGYVNRLKNGVMECTYSLDGEDKFVYNLSSNSPSYYIYDSEEETFTKGSQNELYDYVSSGAGCSKVVIRAHWYDITQIYIIR